MNTSARDYFVKPFDCEDREIVCVASPNCETPSKFRIGWKFDKKIDGVLTETVASRSACERHARIFAMKKGVQFPKRF